MTTTASASSDSLLAIEAFVEGSVPFYDFTVSHGRLVESCKILLSQAFPTWNLDDGNIQFVQCKDGITNKLMKCVNVSSGETVLIRAYGKKSELIINRTAELVNFVTLSKVGLSPPLYGRFKNGFIYGYIEGNVFKVNDMSDPHKSQLVARKVARWHKIHLPGKNEPLLFKTLWKWYGGIPKSYSVADTQQRFVEHIDVATIGKQIASLEGVVVTLSSPIVFCHNDLLSANMIYQEDKNDVAFIDFEYGCHNYRGFDIGNHFCEWAGFECDYSLYPNREQRLFWLTAYFSAFYGKDPAKEDLDGLDKEVNIFSLASHLYWGLWGLVQASFSDIPFDYMGYAIKRFDQFKRTCSEILML